MHRNLRSPGGLILTHTHVEYGPGLKKQIPAAKLLPCLLSHWPCLPVLLPQQRSEPRPSQPEPRRDYLMRLVTSQISHEASNYLMFKLPNLPQKNCKTAPPQKKRVSVPFKGLMMVPGHESRVLGPSLSPRHSSVKTCGHRTPAFA